MKKIGTTESGGILVEMTVDELREFSRLGAAVGGEGWASWSMRSWNDFGPQDFSGIFGAIRAFYEAKFGVNQLRGLMQDFDDFLSRG